MLNTRDIEEILEMEPLNNRDTFLFKCNGCGECCKHREDILLTPYDTFRICKFLKITFDEFLETYCELHIGASSKLPVVSLRTSALCVFLMHGKCLIHEVKPTVCALYPLGRLVGFNEGTYEIQYFLQDVPCGTKDRENVVEDWLKNLGDGHRDCACIWYTMIGEFISLIESVPKADESRIERLAAIILKLSYDGYNYDKDFLTQFEERLEKIEEFCTSYHDMVESQRK